MFVTIGGYRYELKIEHLRGTHLRIKCPYNKQLIEELKNLDGASWDGELKAWIANDNERNRYWLDRLAGTIDLRYDRSPETIKPNRSGLYNHQKSMVAAMHHSHRVVIAGDMGTGKTLAAIELMELVSGPDVPVESREGEWWIVCPSTAKYVWKSELRKWNCKVEPTRIFSYAKLTAIRNIPRNVNIIFDEGHALANWDTKRTQTAYKIARATLGYIVILSGTPEPREPTNWWSLCEILQPGFIQEPNPNKFKYRLGEFETNVALGGHNYKSLVRWKPEELALLRKRLGGMVHVFMKKDCLDLPDKIYNRIDIPYDKKMKGLVDMIVASQGTGIKTLQRLRQLSDGFDYRSTCSNCYGAEENCKVCGGKGKIEVEFYTPKDDIVKDFLVDDQLNGRLVMYAGYRKSIDKLVRFAVEFGWETIRVDGRGIECSGPSIDEFQSDDPRKICFIGHAGSGGQGFTLNKSENIVFYSNDFNAAYRWQAEDRIHRIGTTKAVIHDLCWLPTDRYVLENLQNKRDLLDVSLGNITEYVAKDAGKYYEATSSGSNER